MALKEFMMKSLEDNEIHFSGNENEENSFLMIDRTSLEQWRLAGLPKDTFFTENAVAIQNSSK